ncbi:response regulator [Cyclobacterium jeungdonense]|uniref:PAS domain S-box protein n=1 Tax=Cyclobacterium jeungdonense TaxID=708087 RepID=A0ABT8C841_9BACT|nr:PAS domain S-box protein [Cyclobacterium jeungdonense]MDN3687793.1 PAS domain S-box protein [Cyclobacterium jeungdonense]
MVKDHEGYHLLLVEDNLGDVLLIEEYLHEKILNLELTFANTFQEAKEKLQDPKICLDAIILDLTLPDLQGEELIVKVKELAGDVSIVVLTGYSNIEFGMKSLSLGVSDYLLKDELSPTSLYKSIIYSIGRYQISSQLKDSEKRYKELFQLSPQPMYLYSLESLDFLDVNKAAIDHYGYAKDEFLSMSLRDIRPKEEVSRLERVISGIREGKPDPGPKIFKHRKKNGEIITVEIKGNVIDYQGIKAEVVLANDITDRMRYIHAIEDQNKRLQEIAWLQSHVVRAPLARLMSLVMGMDSLEKDFGKDNFRKMILDSAEELDEIIRDIVNKTDKISLKEKKEG